MYEYTNKIKLKPSDRKDLKSKFITKLGKPTNRSNKFFWNGYAFSNHDNY